jgi:hypothetical protein
MFISKSLIETNGNILFSYAIPTDEGFFRLHYSIVAIASVKHEDGFDRYLIKMIDRMKSEKVKMCDIVTTIENEIRANKINHKMISLFYNTYSITYKSNSIIDSMTIIDYLDLIAFIEDIGSSKFNAKHLLKMQSLKSVMLISGDYGKRKSEDIIKELMTKRKS